MPGWKMKLSFSLLCLFLVACSGRPVNENEVGCAADADCPGGQMGFATCEMSSGLCLCLSDNACDANEFCNAVGSCQGRAGCESNDDCSLGAICNNRNGECVELNAQIQCVEDSHCPFGSVCENFACAQSCRVNGDCPPGRPCMNGVCSASTGACNLDNGNHYCDYGQLCDGNSMQCVTHPEASVLCTRCDPADFFACTNGQWCLVDNTIPPDSCTSDSQCSQYPHASCVKRECFSDSDCSGGGTCTSSGLFGGECSSGHCGGYFCGASSCDENNPCPRGYDCSQLQIVSGDPCNTAGSECTGGRECKSGGENNNVGFCSCISDDDCWSLNFPDATCVNPGPNGACIFGSTCGPADGLTCDDVRE
ncbi:MAG: hypothetical protein CMH56_17100 [Myxococcales bacterium]|nr:hypothetical protein [Myxococcales bacterium]